MKTPQASEKLVRSLLEKSMIPTAKEPVAILGVRGYYRDSMGEKGENDVGIYDDAMFLVGPGGLFIASVANTDPSRLGWNPGVGKPYAMLTTGLWYFRRGPHKGRTPALRQCTDEEADANGIPNDGEFTVIRSYGDDDSRNYKETGYYAINIHSGASGTTSSWGCQTLPPDNFNHFMSEVWRASREAGQNRIPYLLIDGPIT